jgi:hypothetical protein
MPAVTDTWPTSPPPQPERQVHTGPGWYRLAGVVRAAFALNALVYAVDAAGSWWAATRLGSWLDDPATVNLADAQRIDTLNQTTAAAELGLAAVTGILFICWLWQAHNRPLASPTVLRMDRGWSIGGWIIPLANWVIPYRVVQGLNNTTFRPRRPDSGVIKAWWASWLVFTIAGLIVRSSTKDTADLRGRALIRAIRDFDTWAAITAVPGVVAAVLAAVMVTQLTTRMQEAAESTAATS